jgi:hypothetical protein
MYRDYRHAQIVIFCSIDYVRPQVAPHALALGIKVIMFVRSPEKVSKLRCWPKFTLKIKSSDTALIPSCDSYRNQVELFEGSMDDLAAVCRCVRQHLPDFVIFTAALPRGEPFKALSSAVIPAM